MTDGGDNQQMLIPVHVGFNGPAKAPPPVLGSGGGGRFVTPRRDILLLAADFDWVAHGITPRWIGMESGDCLAAIEPSIFHQHGGDELKRFLTGAASRGETAVLVATVGNANDDRTRGVFGEEGTTLLLGDAPEYIYGVRAPERTAISLAAGVGGLERDLGLRLQRRSPDAPWWELSLNGTSTVTAYGPGEQTRPSGTLQPILIDAVGKPVVAVWLSERRDQRWYLVPDQADWDSILDWLTAQALPRFVPAALQRLRWPLLRDPELMTAAESAAEEALADLEEQLARRRAALQEDLDRARAAADPIRDGLLYGIGQTLEQAIAAVLTDAGISVTALDAALGDTASADLLAEWDGRRRLVEVKSSKGNASETLMGRLENHLRNWPAPGRDNVEGGVLVVNHQHGLPPSQRTEAVYSRPEFLRNLPAPVISTRQLFDWWRLGDRVGVRNAIFPTNATATTTAAPTDTGDANEPVRRRRWLGGS